MRVSVSAGALGLSLLLGTAATARAQTGGAPIPCLYDWNVSFSATQVSRIASELATVCADARVVAWSEKIDEAERTISIMSSEERLAAENAATIIEWRRMLDMLNREREHLADQTKRQSSAKDSANAAAPAGRGTATRPSSGASAAPAAAGVPVRMAVAPGYRPWIPPYLKDQLKPDIGFKSILSSVSGAVRLRRGGTETQLQTSARLELQAGDVIATGPSGELNIQLDDSSKVDVGTSTEIVWSNTQPCLGSYSGFPQVVRGVLSWTASGERLRKCPKAAETHYQSINAVGGVFTVKVGELNGRSVTTVTVRNGAVRVADMFGAETTVEAGGSRTFDQPSAAPPAPNDPVVKAIIDGEPLQQGDRWLVPVGTGGVWIDGTKWLIDPKDPKAPDRRTFDAVAGDISGILLYDFNTVGRDALKPMALDMAQRSVPDAKIIKEEWRTVGTLSVLYLEIESTDAGTTEIATGEYFSATQGTVALIVQTPKDELKDHQADIATLLKGLVSVSPFSLVAN